jgi:hypothetical protein
MISVATQNRRIPSSSHPLANESLLLREKQNRQPGTSLLNENEPNLSHNRAELLESLMTQASYGLLIRRYTGDSRQ